MTTSSSAAVWLVAPLVGLVPLSGFAATPTTWNQDPQITLRFVNQGDGPEKWKPKGLVINIGAVTDGRTLDDRAVVGERQVTGPAALPVVTRVPVSDFVDQALRVSLAKWKVSVSAEAEHVLRCEILQFWAIEKKLIASDTRFRFTLTDRAGAILWQGEVAEADHTWADDEKGWVESFCHATQRTIALLFDDPGFRAALTGKSN